MTLDFGDTELRANCMFNFRRGNGSILPGLRHYYVYFDDMTQTYQVVAVGVEITDTDPLTDV